MGKGVISDRVIVKGGHVEMLCYVRAGTRGVKSTLARIFSRNLAVMPNRWMCHVSESERDDMTVRM